MENKGAENTPEEIKKHKKFIWLAIIIANIILLSLAGCQYDELVDKSNRACEKVGLALNCKYKFSNEMCYCDNTNFTLTKEDVRQYNERTKIPKFMVKTLYYDPAKDRNITFIYQ